jgi:hypothetical protein
VRSDQVARAFFAAQLSSTDNLTWWSKDPRAWCATRNRNMVNEMNVCIGLGVIRGTCVIQYVGCIACEFGFGGTRYNT